MRQRRTHDPTEPVWVNIQVPYEVRRRLNIQAEANDLTQQEMARRILCEGLGVPCKAVASSN